MPMLSLTLVLHSYRLNRFPEAVVAFDEVIALFPQFPPAFYHKGLCLARMDKHEDAVQAFDHALDITPDDAPLLLLKGDLT